MQLRPTSVKAAMAVVRDWYRHLDAPQGAKFAVSAWKGDRCVGVALVGLPIARKANNGWTAEVIRVASDGTRNACSFLYARAKRATQALGCRRVLTKTLPYESGASLRAVAAKELGIARAQQWDRANRRRRRRPAEPKLRWEL
jgi:hypothetical protein